MITATRHLHRDVLNADLKSWTDKDLAEVDELLKAKETDITAQIEDQKDFDEDELDEDELDWEVRARDARKFVRMAIGKVRREKKRRQVMLIQSDDKALVSELMSKAQQLCKENEGGALRTRTARKVIPELIRIVTTAGIPLPEDIVADAKVVMWQGWSLEKVTS